MTDTNDKPEKQTTFNNKLRKYVVYYCQEQKPLALALKARAPQRFTLHNIDWHTFPDGTPNLFIHDIDDCADSHVLFLASWSSPKKKDHQCAVCYTLCRTPRVRSLTIVLPFFPSATMERVVKEGAVVLADVDAHRLNSLPAPDSFIILVIYDIHTLQNRFYFRGPITPITASAVPLLKAKLSKQRQDLCIAFPDAGAAKRFGGLFKSKHGWHTVICAKTRSGNTRHVKIYDGYQNVHGKHVIIVDDLVQSGSTLLACMEVLAVAGANKLSCYVTHAVFPNQAHRKFTNEGMLETFWITDSVPKTAARLKNVKPFEIISLIDSLMPEGSDKLKPYL